VTTEEQEAAGAAWDKASQGGTGLPGMTDCPTRRQTLPILSNKVLHHDTGGPRQIEGIDADLRLVIRDLVAGLVDWPFFLSGSTGTGKTCAALCVADRVYGSIFYGFTQLLRDFEWSRTGIAVTRWRSEPTDGDYKNLRYRRVSDSMNAREFWDYLVKAPLLVIDDIATRSKYTDPQYDYLHDMLDARQCKPLIVTSNVKLAKLAEVFDSRIVSRLAAGTYFHLEGKDRRVLK
jgi:hypothetical protein